MVRLRDWQAQQNTVRQTESDPGRWITSVGGDDWGVEGGGVWMNRSDKGTLRALVQYHLSVERDDSTPVIWSKVTPPQCESVAPEYCFQACSALLEYESLNFSLLFLEGIPFLCSCVSALKGTLVSASPPYERYHRFDQTIWWAVILIRVR